MENMNFEQNGYVMVEPTFPHGLLVDLNRLFKEKRDSLQDEGFTIKCYKEKFPNKKNELSLLKLAYRQRIIAGFFETLEKQKWEQRIFIEKSLKSLVKIVPEKDAVILLESLMFFFHWNFPMKIPRKWKVPDEEQAHFHELTNIKQVEAAKILEKIKANQKDMLQFSQYYDEAGKTGQIHDIWDDIDWDDEETTSKKDQIGIDVISKTKIISEEKTKAARQGQDKKAANTKSFEVLNQKPEQVKFYKQMNLKKRETLAKALKGDSLSQCKMGDYYAAPNSKHLDYKEAIRWYEVSAEKGFERALFEMGKIYDMNLPEIKSGKDEALKIYTKLAEQGYPTAQCVLGMKYRFGDGVKEDIEMARNWLYKAAMQRHEAAIRNLADLLLSLHDIENAKKWYQIGAAYGDEYCKRKLGD